MAAERLSSVIGQQNTVKLAGPEAWGGSDNLRRWGPLLWTVPCFHGTLTRTTYGPTNGCLLCIMASL